MAFYLTNSINLNIFKKGENNEKGNKFFDDLGSPLSAWEQSFC
jgi:hypothetical protein